MDDQAADPFDELDPETPGEPAEPEERPFPWALVALTAALAWGAVTIDGGWVRWGCAAAAAFTAAASFYQVWES